MTWRGVRSKYVSFNCDKSVTIRVLFNIAKQIIAGGANVGQQRVRMEQDTAILNCSLKSLTNGTPLPSLCCQVIERDHKKIRVMKARSQVQKQASSSLHLCQIRFAALCRPRSQSPQWTLEGHKTSALVCAVSTNLYNPLVTLNVIQMQMLLIHS